MAVRHVLEYVFEVGVGLDVVEFCGGDKRGDDGPLLYRPILPPFTRFTVAI